MIAPKFFSRFFLCEYVTPCPAQAFGFNAQNRIRSFTATRRMFRCWFLMMWLWHGLCEDSSCLLTFQRSKQVTGGGTMKGIPSIFSTQLDNLTTLVQDAHDSGWESYVAPGSAKMDGKAVTRQKVAILIAGTVARFHLNTSAEHLVAPLVQSGWEVDYFSSLFLGLASAWNDVADAFEADSEFQQVNETHIIENIISQKVSSSGARVIFNQVFSQQNVNLGEKLH